MKRNTIRHTAVAIAPVLCALAVASSSIRLGAADAPKIDGAALPSTDAPLRVGVSPIFPPMVFKQGKELVGVEVELARELGVFLGRKIVFVEVPWPDQLEALTARKTDIIMSSMSITTARRQVMNFSQPYMAVAQMALVRREDVNLYIRGFPLQPKGDVGVLKATTGEFVMQRDFPKAKRKTFSSSTDAAQALMKKRIDLFVTDSPVIWYLAGIHAGDGLSVAPIQLTEEQLAWAMRKGDDTLLEAVNKFIQKAAQEGTFNKIGRRWMAVGP